MEYQKIMQCNSCGNTKEWSRQYLEVTPDCECEDDSWTLLKADPTIPKIPEHLKHRFWSNPQQYKLPKRLAE